MALATTVLDAQLAGDVVQLEPLRVYHGERLHVVQAGDTFAHIGRVYGVPYPWLQQANAGVTDLSVGQTVVIPSLDTFYLCRL